MLAPKKRLNIPSQNMKTVRAKLNRKWTENGQKMDRKWTENGQNIDKDGSKDGQKMDLDKVEKEHATG